MTTWHIVAADVRQYWNKYVRFHRGRLGIWVLAGYAALVFGFLNESPDAILTLPVIIRFSLMILFTIITVLSEGWSRSYQYFFVRQETRLLSRFRVSTMSMVLSFTVITIVETMPSTLTYTVTFSFSHHSVILLFGLLFLVRLGTVIGVSWLGTFVVTNLKLVPGAFAVIELFFKVLHSVVPLALALLLLFRYQSWFLTIAGILDHPWILYGLLTFIWGGGITAFVLMKTKWFDTRFRARRESESLHDAAGQRKRARWFPAHQTPALVVKDIYEQIATGYLLRLAIFTVVQLGLHINVFLIPFIPSRHLNFLSLWLLTPSHIGGFTLWLIMIFFLESFSTVFQNEAGVRRLYWLFHIPIRTVLFAKWIFAIVMGMFPLVVGLLINHEWIMTLRGIYNTMLSVVILTEVISWVVLISSILLVSRRGILLDHTNLQQVSQVPSATIAFWVGWIALVFTTYLTHLVHVEVSLILNLIILVVTMVFLFGSWPPFLKQWYQTHSP